MLKDTEISEGELCFFRFKYPNAFKIVIRMIKAGELTVVRRDHDVSGC